MLIKILHLVFFDFEVCFWGLPLDNISSSLCCTYPKASPFHFLSCCIFLESHLSLQYVRGAYGWLRQGLLDWFVAPTTALYHPTVCFSHCVFLLYILFFNSFALLTWQSVQREAAGGEYLHKYWTKTGRNSRTATGLILDKYFTRPTNTPGGGGGGVWGAWRMRRRLANTHWGEREGAMGSGSSLICITFGFIALTKVEI